LVVVIIYALTVADVLLTHYGITNGHAAEVNPIALWMMQLHFEGTLLAALGVTAVAALFVFRASSRVRWARPALWVIVFLKALAMLPHLYWLSMAGCL